VCVYSIDELLKVEMAQPPGHVRLEPYVPFFRCAFLVV